jgi:hypothetical protein
MKQTCPRRIENTGPFQYPNSDTWAEQESHLRCSYCGSLHPDYLLELMKIGTELGPTDKDYKIYVSIHGVHEGKFYFQHFNKEQKLEFIHLYNKKPRTFTIGYPGYFYVLPFFIRIIEEVNNDDTSR